MIVSHDSGFLDKVCTGIIHYEKNFKLKKYRGNLSKFVEQRPEAAAYYSLDAASTKFKLPEPGYLEGVTSKDRAILKMRSVNFKYPTADTQILNGVNVQVSLNSRVAVVGPNGAGKSTLIKLLTGELEPVSGTVWKHPNLRVAYVAQHAFHHVEQHLDKTPNQYIQWRYASGEDRENLEKVDRKVRGGRGGRAGLGSALPACLRAWSPAAAAPAACLRAWARPPPSPAPPLTLLSVSSLPPSLARSRSWTTTSRRSSRRRSRWTTAPSASWRSCWVAARARRATSTRSSGRAPPPPPGSSERRRPPSRPALPALAPCLLAFVCARSIFPPHPLAAATAWRRWALPSW